MSFPLNITKATFTTKYNDATAQGNVFIASPNPIVDHPLHEAYI